MIFESKKSIENKLKELGFNKVYESDLVVQFERWDDQFKYTNGVDLVHKQSGKHLIQSFEKGKNTLNDLDSIMVGIEFKHLKLFMKYFKKLKW